MMGTKSSYFIAAISSIGIHAVVILAVLANWEPDSKKTIVKPQYIQAELIELAPKKKPVKKPKATPSVDRAAKLREIDKRKAKEKELAQQKLAAQRKAQQLKDQQQAEKARKALEEKQRKANEERARKQAELARQQRKAAGAYSSKGR